MHKVIIEADYSRRIPDPLNKIAQEYNIEHFVLFAKANKLPKDIPVDANPRAQKTNRSIYKDVRKSLDAAAEPTFHLKNKGITILAERVDVSADSKIYTLHIKDGQGIADGGHTYAIVKESQDDGSCPDNQYVRIEVIKGVSPDMAVDISSGLNTAVQVQEYSLANLEHKFDWIAESLPKTFNESIAYKENEASKPFDIQDVITYMIALNIDLYPPTLQKHPKQAYTSKSACLDIFLNEDNTASFKKFQQILPDVLRLRDYISGNSADLYNKGRREDGARGAARKMEGVFETRTKSYPFPFSKKESNTRLYDGTFYPIFAAMRVLVEQKVGDDYFSWTVDSFKEVTKIYDQLAAQLVTTTYNTGLNYGRRPNAVGKDENLWSALYNIVEIHMLRKKLG
jgi:hypothetical protein